MRQADAYLRCAKRMLVEGAMVGAEMPAAVCRMRNPFIGSASFDSCRYEEAALDDHPNLRLVCLP